MLPSWYADHVSTVCFSALWLVLNYQKPDPKGKKTNWKKVHSFADLWQAVDQKAEVIAFARSGW